MQIPPHYPTAAIVEAPGVKRPSEPVGDVVWAMDVFAELVQASGPLCALRFDDTAFSGCLGDLPTPLNEEAVERAFARHIGILATPSFLRRLQTTLTAFCRTSYIDETHRVAARMAKILTPQDALSPKQQGRDAPSLYPIFRAQAFETLNIAMD